MTEYYHINLMVNRGYSSCTALHDAYKRISNAVDNGKEPYILYLGDHDPSGLDMVRDIRERLEEFGAYPEVRAIALTTAQVRKYNPPPNPAKISDPRAKWYIKEFGNTSWEVDALNPKVLHALVKEHVEGLIDMRKFRARVKQEETDKEMLSNVVLENE